MSAIPIAERPTLALTGASGFVGKHLIDALQDRYRIVALTRSASRDEVQDPNESVQWKRCDLFSHAEVRRGLAGADYAIYLVHSMLPNSRLTQARFEDLDLLLADNFARAAQANRVKQIVYLGGLIEEGCDLSRHLASRLEVGQCLASRGTPVTTLRAGLILGPGGSSLRMVVNLVRRLPLMVLPAWTESKTQSIAIWDIVRAFEQVLGDEERFDREFDLGHPEVMTYGDLIQKTARVLGVKRTMIHVPIRTTALSTLWCQLFSSSPRSLVKPLIGSLGHDLLARPNALNEALQPEMVPIETALRRSIDERGRLLPSPRHIIEHKDRIIIRRERRVRSVQRCPAPQGWNAEQIVREYVRWLDRTLGWLLKIDINAYGHVQFAWRWPGITLLKLIPNGNACSPTRHVLRIRGGLLVQDKPADKGRLEFRLVMDRTQAIIAIHNYAPRIPWYLYVNSQALVHLVVMAGFRRRLRKLTQAQIAPKPEDTTVLTAASSAMNRIDQPFEGETQNSGVFSHAEPRSIS